MHESHKYVILLDNTYTPKEFAKMMAKSNHYIYYASTIFPYIVVRLNDAELEHVRNYKGVKEVRLSTNDNS